MNRDETRFVRHYECMVQSQVFEAEFDGGFLNSSRLVSHAHNHAGIELIAVYNGISGLCIDNESYLLNDGEILFIPAGIYHANDMSVQEGERFCFRVYLSGKRKINSPHPLYDLLIALKQPLKLYEPELMPILSHIRAEMNNPAASSQEMITALLTQCFILLLRLAGANTAMQDTDQQLRNKRLIEERMKKIDIFFSRRYMQQVTLSDLASELYVSATHTNRILRTFYGRSFSEKLRDTRLQQARILLTQTDYSANRVAQEIGYISPAGFYSAFRAAFGMTPTEFRKCTRQH